MRSNFVLLVGLSAVFVLLSIYGTSYVNGQTSANNSSAENENGTSSADSVLQTDNLDPFKSQASSSNVNENNPSQDGSDASANSNNDDSTIANDDSTNDNNNNDDDSTNDNNNNDDSSNNNNDDRGKDRSDDDNSSDKDKESKDDRKFELPFP